MKTFFYCTIASVLLISFSCKKETEDPVAPTVSINLSHPEENAFITDSLLHINGTITSNAEIHGYLITLYNAADMGVLFDTAVGDHTAQFNVDYSPSVTVSDTISAKLVIEVAVDHDGTTKKFERNFSIIP